MAAAIDAGLASSGSTCGGRHWPDFCPPIVCMAWGLIRLAAPSKHKTRTQATHCFHSQAAPPLLRQANRSSDCTGISLRSSYKGGCGSPETSAPPRRGSASHMKRAGTGPAGDENSPSWVRAGLKATAHVPLKKTALTSTACTRESTFSSSMRRGIRPATRDHESQ